jgi:hypothetical protein
VRFYHSINSAHAYWSFPIGALVLAHSLKDAGTTKKLAVLTVDVSADAMVQLQVRLTDRIAQPIDLSDIL